MKEKTILELYGLKKTPGEVGVEVEMEGKGLPGYVPGWKIHDEQSLRGGGIEYVFDKPAKRDDYEKLLFDLEKTFEADGTKLNPSDYCGIHVHINCQDLTFTQILNYTCLWFLLEIPLVKWCGDKREGNMFALRASDAEAVIKLIVDAIPHKDFRYAMLMDWYRYAAWNLEALGKFGSIESRVLPTTPKFAERTTKWVKVLLKLKDKAMFFKTPAEIVNNFSLQSPLKFARGMLDEYAEEFLYKGVEKDLYKGARLIQDIAFAQDFKQEVAKPKPEFDKNLGNPFEIRPAPVPDNWRWNEALDAVRNNDIDLAEILRDHIRRDANGRFAPKVKPAQPAGDGGAW